MNDREQALVNFIANLMNHGNKDTIEETATIIEEYLPSGSGFDNGTRLNLDTSSDSKLVFNTAFHHMSEHGYYTKWTDHTVTVRPTFQGLDIRVSGRNHNDIKDYIAECFDRCLEENVDAKTGAGGSLGASSLRERYLEEARIVMAKAGDDTIEDVRSDLRHARERIDGLAAERSELLGQVAKLTDERDALAVQVAKLTQDK